jgi:hypothetical protein
MSLQTINIGTAANDGTGDTIRAAWTKQVAMNAELYNMIAALQGGTPTLATCAFSSILRIGSAVSGTITGATTGSTLVSNVPGITINSAARTFSGTPTGNAATIANAIVETLTGATNSPKSNSVATQPVIVQTTTFSMTQLVGPKAIFQRLTDTGGSQGKGTGTIYLDVNVSVIGTPYFRMRSDDGTTILQASTPLAAFTATGAQTLAVTNVDARLGWYYLDTSGDGTTWTNGTTLISMGINALFGGQSLSARMLVAASDNISMTTAGVVPDPNTSTYVIPGDGANTITTAAWRPWDATSAGNTGALNSAGGAKLSKTLVAQLGLNVGIIGHPIGGTDIQTHTMLGSNGASIRQIIKDVGGFEYTFLMIGHSNAAALVTGGVGARDFKGTLSIFYQMLTLANNRGNNYKSVVWAIPNESSGGTWGTLPQQNEVRRAMYEFAKSSTASALMSRCNYVNSYTITLSGDNIHEGQAGAIQIADIVTTAFISGNDAPAGDDTFTPTNPNIGTFTTPTFTSAGKFTAAALDGGYALIEPPYARGGIANIGFWYKGTPAGGSVAYSGGNEYLQCNNPRWTWHPATGSEVTATTGPTTGTDSTTWHYLSIDRVLATLDGTPGYLRVYQDGILIIDLPSSAVQAGNPSGSAIGTFTGAPGNYKMNTPFSDWRAYTKPMGTFVPTVALTANEPFLFTGFTLDNTTASLI